MPEWISVEERLPTYEEYKASGGYVIAAFESGMVRPSWEYKEAWTHEKPNDKVTHWMPFPDPPKEGEG